MASGNRILIFLGDGMGGRPVPELGGKTAVEAAQTPVLDRMARDGATGLLSPIGRGIAAGSDTAHMAILGYDPFTLYRGRGPFEAKGVGLDVAAGDVAFRCNFATVEGRKIIDRRAGRIKSGTEALSDAISEQVPEIDGVRIMFKNSVEHRAALVLRGEGLDEHVSEVDPHHEEEDYWECKPLPGYEDNEAARRTADVVNKFVQRSYEVLSTHPVNVQRAADGLFPANITLPRGVGTAVELQPFADRYRLNGAMIVEVDLVRGLGLYLGMDIIECEGATGGRDTDEMAIAKAVVKAFDTHNFVLANIKAPDLGGHDSDAPQKIEAIEKVDRALGYITQNLDAANTVIMLAADHCTPITVGDHSGDPIPAVFHGCGVTPDHVSDYGERSCARGSVGHFGGCDVMNMLGNYAGTAAKFGA